MSANVKFIDQKVREQLIDIKDFAKYHRYETKQSDPVDMYMVKKLKNDRYDYFHRYVLKPRSKDDKIHNEEASYLWIAFEDAREVITAMRLKNKFRKSDMELINFWIEEFKKPIEDLFYHGINVISSGLGILVDYYREWFAVEKFRKIYSQTLDIDEIINAKELSNDKLTKYILKHIDEWYKLTMKNEKFVNESEAPFNMKEYDTKAKYIIAARH